MDVEIGNLLKMAISIAIVMVVGLLGKVYTEMARKPKRERLFLRKQGINGPPPMLLLGNLLQMKTAIDAAETEAAAVHNHPSAIIAHDSGLYILPFLHQWTQQYGKVFAFSLGVKTILHVNQPELLKEIATITSWDLGKPSFLGKEFGPLLGQGIISSNGAYWATQRTLVAPHLYLDKVKGMVKLMTDSSKALVDLWINKMKIAEGGVIDISIDSFMRKFSGDVISKACFGSSYSHNEGILLKLGRLEEATSNLFAAAGVPGLRYIPTKKNKEAWALEKEVYKLIMTIVKERKESGQVSNTEDFLQNIIEGAENSSGLSKDASNNFIVDNLKTMFLAGYATTAVTASWCLMLLASNPEWQVRVRNEVVRVCKGQILTANMLLQMKELTMVIYETLRLYPPAPAIVREVFKDMKIGGIEMTKGMQIMSNVYPSHTDPDNWGPDSYEFNPQRFANGVTGACKFPHMYIPFGFGSRICLGQHLAMTELKVLISSIVANFSFSLSPTYVHAFEFTQVLHPKFGVNLVLKCVNK